MDIIFVEGLAVKTTIGIFDWEKNILQTLVIDIEVGCDIGHSALSDDISDTISYADISQFVIDFVQGRCFGLVEKVASELAEDLLNAFSIKWLRLKVAKPGAVPEAKSVGVIIERGKR